MKGMKYLLPFVLLLMVFSVSASWSQTAKQGEKIRPLSKQEKARIGERCPVHGEKLKLDTVPILYGILMIDEDYLEAEKTLFPNANTRVFGGDLVQEETKAEVLYCPKCREAEAKWNKEHKHG
jgi:hypothetical protein